MAPRLWQAIRGVHAEEVAARGLSKAVEMLVRPNEGRFRIQVNAGFLSYLPNRRLDQCLALVDTAGGNLNSRVGMIPVFEDEKPILSLDVDDNSLSAGHARIVGVARRVSDTYWCQTPCALAPGSGGWYFGTPQLSGLYPPAAAWTSTEPSSFQHQEPCRLGQERR